MGSSIMDIYVSLAIVALVVAAVTLGRGIIVSMNRGGGSEHGMSPRLMFRRSETRAAAVALLVAGGLFTAGWLNDPGSTVGRLYAELGVLPAEVIRETYPAGSPERQAYGGVSGQANSYLVLAAITDARSGERVTDAEVTATVSLAGGIGITKTEEVLEPARFAGKLTYGGYFQMPKAGTYQIDLAVKRPGVSGNDLIRKQYRRP